jgi:fumarylacetoacetase
MSYSINETHDPNLQSWVESANDPASDFPIQNLPLGLFTLDPDDLPSIGVAIGDQVLNLSEAAETLWGEDFDDELADACMMESLDLVMDLPQEQLSELRRRLSRWLRADAPAREREVIAEFLLPQAEVQMVLPAEIGDYTDFYASVYHATNVGKLFRPDQPLLPNYKWVPIGYHGRASSIVVSGTEVRRPLGQTMTEGAEQGAGLRVGSRVLHRREQSAGPAGQS